jgi:nifR3 family TIM-barrel protein
MEQLGAGLTVSELISCHGIEYQNQKTLDMLRIDPREKNIGIQLFGESAESLNHAAKVATEYGPKFLDLNMGCPVKKVVNKGGGSALLKDEKKLGEFFQTMTKGIEVPFSIKIRTGWDIENLNADRVIHIAEDTGIEMVAIHGRTRNQQYTGQADWGYLEKMAISTDLPIIGNGDLHSPGQVQERLMDTHCQALMIARGALRNPFIFLEGLNTPSAKSTQFDGLDYWEVIQKFYEYVLEAFASEKTQMIQLRKIAVWFSAGFSRATQYRQQAFTSPSIAEFLKVTQDYFESLENKTKHLNYQQSFMSSGHG